MRLHNRRRLRPTSARYIKQRVKLQLVWRRKLRERQPKANHKRDSSKQLSIVYRSHCTRLIASITSSPGIAIGNWASLVSPDVRSWEKTFSRSSRASDAMCSSANSLECLKVARFNVSNRKLRPQGVKRGIG